MSVVEKTVEGMSDFLVFLDNLRIDQYVLSFRTNISTAGGMGAASIDMLYVPDFYRTESVDKAGNRVTSDGIENMTTVRIYSKNMFNGRYVQIFEGNIRSKNRTRTRGGYSLSFEITDYMTWFNKTIVPLSIPTNATFENQIDILRWRTQGIDTAKVSKIVTNNEISFKGKTLAEYIRNIVTQTLKNNKLFSDTNTVAAWDNPAGRIYLMGDVDPALVKSQVIDFVLMTSATYLNSMYVAFNDVARNLMFEFFQDRDGIVRFKPPFWNEGVLRDHVIDPSMILSISENTDYNSMVTRVSVSGSLEEYQDGAEAQGLAGMLTPGVAYVGDQQDDTAAFFATSRNTTAVSVTEPYGSGSSTSPGISQGSSKEMEELLYTVQQEAGNGSKAHKEMICFVVKNRMESSKFPNTMHEVLSAHNQFVGYSNYTNRRNIPDQGTVDAANAVFVDGTAKDNSKGAVFFCNPKSVSGATLKWFKSLNEVAVIQDHHFYKNF